ncbi:MAG: 30S ribosomal protein S1, partial [Deltaproteobacteria bacterium]|nr:30S ribosomal protein S1 [Deltaproteobacteria bacterium]
SEGVLAVQEFRGEDGTCTVAEGDEIEAYFLSSRNGEMTFTLRIGGDSASAELIAAAAASGIPIEGFVEKEIKGGFEVRIAGTVRAFCPFSQMGLRRVEDAQQYIGQRIAFKVAEYGENGRKIVLSNRAILQEERRKQKDALRETLKEGATVTGTVISIRDFGAFVDIGGIEGLLPVSEIAWDRVENIHDRLSVGQDVEVIVLKLDWGNDRFSFSLKAALPDPWKTAAATFAEGSTLSGTVARLTKFGAFVTLAPGIDGLVHISALGQGKRINHPREVVEEGQSIDVKVTAVDVEKKRISLVMPGAEPQRASRASDEKDYKRYVDKGDKGSSQSLGTLGDLMKAKLAAKQKK